MTGNGNVTVVLASSPVNASAVVALSHTWASTRHRPESAASWKPAVAAPVTATTRLVATEQARRARTV